MSIEENKRTVRRLFEEIITQDRSEVAAEIFATDFVWPQFDLHGPDGALRWVRAFRTAFPDVEDIVEEQAAEGDVVFTRVTFRGTQSGPWYGMPATGQRVEQAAVGIDRFRDGLIIERMAVSDLAGALRQLGHRSFPTATSPVTDV